MTITHVPVLAGELSQVERDAFEGWLARSPEHQDAYAGVEEFWAAAGELGRHPDYAAARQRAEAAVDQARFTRRALAAGLAFAVVGLGSVGAYLQLAPGSLTDQSYRTAVGQRATVNLSDGSQVTLNTDLDGDGVDEQMEQMPTSNWKPLSFLISTTGAFSGVRFEITKRGSGDAVLAQIGAKFVSDTLCQGLAATGRVRFFEPDAAFYLFCSVEGFPDSRALALRLIDEAGVGATGGVEPAPTEATLF